MKRRPMLALTLAILFSACSDDSTGPSVNTAFAGTYTLRTINGAALPFVLQDSPVKVEVLNDAINLDADGTYASQVSFRVTSVDGVTNEVLDETGRWSVANGTVMFEPLGSMSYGATIGNGKITFLSANFTAIYEK